jgi:hypothetical protein
MNRLISTSLIAFALGCSAATTSAPPTDAGLADAAGADAAGCGAASSVQCYAGSAGVCGDTFVAQVCTRGAWACPPGTLPAAECRCYGSRPGCTCGASGWTCPNLGSDAGRSFACGPVLRCDLDAQYCEAFSGGIRAGVRYRCATLPTECGSAPSCACMGPQPEPASCRQEADGSIFITINAP